MEKTIINHTKILSKFILATGFNSGFNFVMFSSIFFLLNFEFIVFSYITSSVVTTILAYFINKYFVFKNENKVNNFTKFIFIELLLIFLTTICFELIDNYFNITLINSVILIFSIRIVISYIAYKYYVFKE